jgi:MazG family protein
MDPDRLSRAIVILVELVATLRGPGGCPWDAKQTDSTIKIYLLEEAYEALEAIEGLSPQDVCQELGDLLFQILFLAQLASERKEFDFLEIVERITEKMIHRHPHVFGHTRVANADDVAINWAKIKRAENGISGDSSFLFKGIPAGLPALLKGHRLGERAAKAGFNWPEPDDIWEKVRERFEKMGSAVVKTDRDQVADNLGDLLFGLVNLARHWGLNAEHLLRIANQKFLERFNRMERGLRDSGVELEEATPEQMNLAWAKAKDPDG